MSDYPNDELVNSHEDAMSEREAWESDIVPDLNVQDAMERDMQREGHGTWEEAIASDDDVVLGAKLYGLFMEFAETNDTVEARWTAMARGLRANVRLEAK